MINQNRIIKNFVKMAEISSPSLNEREIADYLIKILKEIGMQVYEDKAGEQYGGNSGNIIGKLPGKKPTIMFSAHMDTVKPCENIETTISGEYIKTKSDTILGSDDKAGIAAIIEAIKVIKENNIEHPEIIVIFSIAEEIRLLGAKYFESENYDIDYGFILDSNGHPGSVVKKAPYHDQIEFIFKGKAAHAGIEPEKGINALFLASKAISKMKIGRIDEETTFNLGIINGGEATNIVMPELRITGECRSFDEQKLITTTDSILKICKDTAKNYNGKFEHNITREYDGFSISEDSLIMNIVKNSCRNIDLNFEAQNVGGGSDTNVYNAKGINTVNLGIGMTNVHSTDEKIKIIDLIDIARLLVEISKESIKNGKKQ